MAPAVSKTQFLAKLCAQEMHEDARHDAPELTVACDIQQGAVKAVASGGIVVLCAGNLEAS
jgi:hypothetical protein